MRILITGSAGYIGTHLVKYVEQAYATDELHFCDKKNDFPYQDFENEDFDVVFHLGAISTIMDSFSRADEMMQVNAFDLIPFFTRNRIGKFLFTSTGAIYGNCSHAMREEEAKWMDALCPYAQSKYVAEGIIRKLCPNHVIFRLGNVFGGDYSPREEWLSITHFQRDNPIVVYGGEQVRDFIHVHSVCWALVQASLDRKVCGTYNIARGEGQLLKQIAEQFGRERGVPVEYKPHREGDAKYVVLDITKAVEADLLYSDLPANDYHL